jgi:hypothetical protein
MLHLAILFDQKVRMDGGYDVFGETPKTARETRAVPISNCMVPYRCFQRTLTDSVRLDFDGVVWEQFRPQA